MKIRNRIQFYCIFVLSISSFIFLACGDDDMPTTPSQPSTISGMVTDDEGFSRFAKSAAGVEGAAVVVAQLQSDGALKTVSNDTVLTDAAGHFLVETDIHGERNLIVIASKDTNEWRAVVSSEVRRGTTVASQPLNAETTLEANVYVGFASQGQKDFVAYTEIASNIDFEIGTILSGNDTALNLVAAIRAQAEAHDLTLMNASIGASQSQLDDIKIARTQAQASLETALQAANNNQNAIDAAFGAYDQADMNAYLESGLSVVAYAKARDVSATVLLKNMANLSSEAQFALWRRASARKAIVIDNAIQENFSALGALGVQLSEVGNAGTTLRTSITTANSYDEIALAFQNYHNSILIELQDVANVHASAILSIDTSIGSVSGVKLILETAVSTSAAIETIVDAYIAFFNAVAVLAETTLTSASTVEVEAISNVLVLVNMQV